ncbi:hypothetical protein [Rhodospirillaceae bacterium SYSU D60014]|uniref:hypothetical protein n=1 Tax=Virgifigura deserti TaxID=2268457 RepID=UPI000E664AA6
MRRYILGAKLVTLAVWTVVCLGAYVLLNLVGDGLIRHLDALPVGPEEIEFVSWLLALFQQIGFGLVIGVWLFGAVVILVVGWIARRFASGPEQRLPDSSRMGDRR